MTRLRRWLAAARETAPFMLAAAWFSSGYVPYEHIAELLSRRAETVREQADRRSSGLVPTQAKPGDWLTSADHHYMIFNHSIEEDM